MEFETSEEKIAPVTEQYLPLFCQELYQLYRTGITPADGLELLEEDETEPQLKRILRTGVEGMRDGLPVAEALAKTGAFPTYLTDMISLADGTGRLEDTLLALQRYYERRIRLRAEIRSAVTVPVVLLAVMAAVVVLLVTQVLPVFDRVFAQMGVRMGGVAAGMMRFGTALAGAGTWVAVIVALLAAAGIAVALIPSLRKLFLGWFTFRYGGRGLLGQMRVSRFASAMAMATASGMGMDEAAELSAKLCAGAREIDEKIQLFRNRVREGTGSADALAESGLFSHRDCRVLKLSERTGSLPETLETLAARMQEESLRRVDRLVGLIEPGIVLFTSILAGVILLSVMLPMMGLLFGIG